MAARRVWLEHDLPQRAAIDRFERAIDDRHRRVVNTIETWQPLPDDFFALRFCSAEQTCEEPCGLCGVCDYKAADLSRAARENFDALVRADPEVILEMLVAVPASWQVPIGHLHEVQPARLLEAVAQRIRRKVKVPIANIGLDLTFNRAIAPRRADHLYWQPHANIGVPLQNVPAVKKALASLCRWAPLVPAPLRSVQIGDPLVGGNYTTKFSLTGVIGREQLKVPGKNHYRLKGFTFRIPQHAFAELLKWRSTFPPEDLHKLVGIGSSANGWRFLCRRT